jgi:DNA-binding NarL/FixJ family response regulator
MPVPRILVIGDDGAVAALLANRSAWVGTAAIADVLRTGVPAVDLIVLCSAVPSRDVRALAGPSLPPLLVIARSLRPDEVVPALRAGAVSLLVDGEYTRAELLDAIQGTLRGLSRLSPLALTTVVRHLRRPQAVPRRFEVSSMTRREREILELLSSGRSNGDIAGELCLAEKTVRNVVSRIYKKLRVRTRAEAMVAWLGQ